jgi:hypothetical protein
MFLAAIVNAHVHLAKGAESAQAKGPRPDEHTGPVDERVPATSPAVEPRLQ